MSFYGNIFLNEEYLEEQVILNEMHFSKNDLQDPKTLDKILKAKDKFESTSKKLMTLFIILGIIASSTLAFFTNFIIGLGGLYFIIAALIWIGTSLSSAPAKSFKKNSEKYVNKVNQLLKKSEEALYKDPKNKEKYQKIIDNCNNVLKEIKKREKEAAELLSKQEFQEVIDKYEALIEWIKKPFVIGHTGDGYDFSLFAIAEVLGIPERALIENLKSKGKYYNNWKYVFYNINNKNQDYNIFKDDEYIMISSDDDYVVFYSKRNNCIYYTNISGEYIKTSLYKEGKGDIDCDKKLLIEADKELGYYLLSECPDGVIRKEFPIKF